MTSVRNLGSSARGGVAERLFCTALLLTACRDPAEEEDTAAPPACDLPFEEEVVPVLNYATQAPCSPLDPVRRPMRIQPPVAVAKAPTGGLFVVDRVGGGMQSRVYVSPGPSDALRWVAASIGGISESDEHYSYEEYFFQNPAQRLVLRVHRSEGGHEHLAPGDFEMGLLEGSAMTEAAPSEFEASARLESMAECTVKSYGDLGGPLAEAEYITTDANGSVLVVARGAGYSFEEIFVFYGPPSGVKQRQTMKFSRKRDGGTTTVVFRVDRGEASAVFPIECEQGSPCPGELSLPDGNLVLGPWSRDPADLDGAAFLCATNATP